MILAFLLIFELFHLSFTHQPAYQNSLEDVCNEKICKFHLSIREEMSMTEKYQPGRSLVTTAGETMRLDFDKESKEGYLIRKLGHYFNKPSYSDLNGTRVQLSNNVITADGFRRKLITINGVFPGPTLQVKEGVEVCNSKTHLSI